MSTWRVADEALNEMGERIVANAAGSVTGFAVAYGELSIEAPAHRIVDVLRFLRDSADLQFHQLIDICGSDYPQREQRFDVVYHLLSMTKNRRLRVKVRTDEDTPVPSVVSVYPAADWFERETFDMYGVFFEGHPDLRRLLTDYGFHGHPLRKDFPMTGYVEVRYDEDRKQVIYEPVKLTQDFRSFDFLSPWEAMTSLPGDEKAHKGEPT